jgi:hypothetical protein
VSREWYAHVMRDVGGALLLFALFAVPASARGPTDSLSPPPPPDVSAGPGADRLPDVAWAAAKDRVVTLETSSGTVSGHLLAFDDLDVVLTLPNGVVTTVARADIKLLRMGAVAAVAVPDLEVEPERTGEPRHFGLHLGLSPGIAADFEYGAFYMFLSASPLATLASAADMYGFCTGAGFSIVLPSHWHFDVFADAAPLWWSNGGPVSFGSQGMYMGVGVGIGFHYTSPSGWAIAFKAPLIGAAPILSGTAFSYDIATATLMSYLANVVSMPIVSLGYRF